MTADMREELMRLADWCDTHRASPTTADIRGIAGMRTNAAHWLIEGPRDDFHTIKAEAVEVVSSCLVFRDAGEPVTIIAAGQWLSVVPDEAKP